jgi:hypothetical protein
VGRPRIEAAVADGCDQVRQEARGFPFADAAASKANGGKKTGKARKSAKK